MCFTFCRCGLCDSGRICDVINSNYQEAWYDKFTALVNPAQELRDIAEQAAKTLEGM